MAVATYGQAERQVVVLRHRAIIIDRAAYFVANGTNNDAEYIGALLGLLYVCFHVVHSVPPGEIFT